MEKIEIDSPLSMALDSRYAHSKLVSYTWKGRIENVGVENMTLISDYDKDIRRMKIIVGQVFL